MPAVVQMNEAVEAIRRLARLNAPVRSSSAALAHMGRDVPYNASVRASRTFWRRAKRAGIAVSILLIAVWFVSYWFRPMWYGSSTGVGLSEGQVEMGLIPAGREPRCGRASSG